MSQQPDEVNADHMYAYIHAKTEDQINGQLAMMVHTAKLESEIEAGTTYWECFKGVDLRRTEVCCMAFAGQILSGSSFAYSPV